MQIRRLKLTGFKSFVEPAELRIEPGLTGVVGPNGCGKSNLLEAIRWVMGESSAKSMRGGGMEDVIFAGTAQRPPRDFAEVVLHAADSAGEELEVVRRIERGAGSAYRVNGRDVRAKDVALVFADAATGAHSPALVSQGRIAAVISAKPAERRQMLEEAAGIAGLHVRRKDAEQKLRGTEANLARLEDLMAGLDQQIAVLRRQARAAERYTAVSEKIRVAEARLIFARWRDAAAAAQAARDEALSAEARVNTAQAAAAAAHAAQRDAAAQLAMARETLADRRDDTSAASHRLAALSSQLEAAQQRLADLERQRSRLEQDKGDADRLTGDAAAALAKLQTELAASQTALGEADARRPALAMALENADRAARTAELALAQATAHQAGVEAEWRVADAEIAAARARLTRLDVDAARLAQQRAALAAEGDPDTALAAAQAGLRGAEQGLVRARTELAQLAVRKTDLQAARDAAASNLSAARADLAGVDREHQALHRDREARSRQARTKHGLPPALQLVRAQPGYERALAAVLGRDAQSELGPAPQDADGRFWTGADSPAPVAQTLAAHVPVCPPELFARLALVHVAAQDDGRVLAPGEWLVTMDGFLRRWDGFVARGEGGAEAARLEAENRYLALSEHVPLLRAAVSAADAAHTATSAELAAVQAALVTGERAAAAAADNERTALRALDRAEAAKARLALRRAELDCSAADLQQQRVQAEADVAAAQTRRMALPDPDAGRHRLTAAQVRNDAARQAMQAATAMLAAHDSSVAAGRERTAAQASDIKGWQARAGDAARRLAEMSRRIDEIEQERAVVDAKPAALACDIVAAEKTKGRLGAELAAAEAIVLQAGDNAQAAEDALSVAVEALTSAREGRAGAAARAENEEQRRAEMSRMAGERFQCPPPLLPERFAFPVAEVTEAATEAAGMDRLTAERERIGPVNLVAASELSEAESRYGTSAAEQAELTEAVHRLRGSIGNLNREGRERLRAAFDAVDGHFRQLFARLFEGGQAHLALVDSDDPLEAGLEISAQPPGKRLQSLTLLSGGEQALTAVALIFALFLTNPAPICVLDEVDAPLDDANIERFCDLLDAMTLETATRYLIVTHNAVTMSRMHRLFGVTMVEQGISRLVSVDLGAAEHLLAAE
ncbi:MAG: AAA family ATPase [Pseudomonadota bacterium]